MLDLGADDYVNKPFGIGELMARIRASLRHRAGANTSDQGNVFKSGSVTVDKLARSVSRDGVAVRLTPKEFDLLLILIGSAGRVVTHRQILVAVWGPAHVHDTQYLRVFIGQLRHKLEDDAADPKLIQTEPGVGYRFAASDL